MRRSRQGGDAGNVLLLSEGNHRAALAFARSLARHGCETFVATQSSRALALASRYVAGRVPVPELRDDPDGYLNAVLRALDPHRIALVVPVDDPALALVSAQRQRFPSQTALAVPGADAVDTVLDKSASLALARRLDVPVPRGVEDDDVTRVSEWARGVGFPVVGKVPDPDRAPAQQPRMKVLESAAEVGDFLALVKAGGGGDRPIFQEFVRGEHRNLCCFAVDGEVIAMHEHLSLRRSGRVAILREVREADPTLARHAKRLLGALRLNGLAIVQFIADPVLRKAWYLEINARPWASIQGSVNAGWDFPLWCYRFFTEGVRPEVPALRTSSLTRDHGGDLGALLDYLHGGPSPTPNATPSRLQAVLDYCSGFSPRIGSDTFAWRDPRPAVQETLRLIRRELARRSRAD